MLLAINLFFVGIVFFSILASTGISFLVLEEVVLGELVGGWGVSFFNTIMDKVFHRKLVHDGNPSTYSLYWSLKAIKAVFLIGIILLVIFISPMNIRAFVVSLFAAYFIFLGGHLWEVNMASFRTSGTHHDQSV